MNILMYEFIVADVAVAVVVGVADVAVAVADDDDVAVDILAGATFP